LMLLPSRSHPAWVHRRSVKPYNAENQAMTQVFWTLVVLVAYAGWRSDP